MKTLTDKVFASFERLSGREQIMVLAIVVCVLAMVLFLGGYGIRKDLKQRRTRISAKTEKLEEIAALKGDYQRRLAEQNRLAEEVQKNEGFSLLSYLEDVSNKAQIELGNATPRNGEKTNSDQVQEEAAEVKVRGVSLDRLYEFMRLVEEGNRLVVVRRLKIKHNYQDDKKLDAAITIGTFKPAKG